MERNINRAGWVQLKYERAEELSSQAEPMPLPMPAPMPQLSVAPMPPLPSVPLPQPPVVPVPQPPVAPMPDNDCGDMVLVMSYVKKQQWDETYEPEAGLERGTIFPELDLPFVGEGACPYDE